MVFGRQHRNSSCVLQGLLVRGLRQNPSSLPTCHITHGRNHLSSLLKARSILWHLTYHPVDVPVEHTEHTRNEHRVMNIHISGTAILGFRHGRFGDVLAPFSNLGCYAKKAGEFWTCALMIMLDAYRVYRGFRVSGALSCLLTEMRSGSGAMLGCAECAVVQRGHICGDRLAI